MALELLMEVPTTAWGSPDHRGLNCFEVLALTLGLFSPSTSLVPLLSQLKRMFKIVEVPITTLDPERIFSLLDNHYGPKNS